MLFDLNKVWNDNKKREQLQKTIYDYVIIGSGPAGIIFCNEILKKKHSKNILIIEKGDLIQNKFEKISYKFLPIKLTSRAFAIGGTSNIWSNISSSLEDFEMKQRWKRKYINFWPLNFEQLKNAVEKRTEKKH
jgi:cation diffusion facilitator CzcD-associated flavoprotein CzcO